MCGPLPKARPIESPIVVLIEANRCDGYKTYRFDVGLGCWVFIKQVWHNDPPGEITGGVN